jgi:hypothetical protein
VYHAGEKRRSITGLSVTVAAGTKEKVKGIFHAHGNGKIIEKTSNQVA